MLPSPLSSSSLTLRDRTALVSPKDLRLAAPHLPTYTTPRITLRCFPSGLTILHTPRFSPSSFTSRVLSLLDLRQALSSSFLTAFDVDRPSAEREGATTLEIAQEEKMALNLAKEMLEAVESRGELVRDEQGDEGTRWHRNFFRGFVWDGTPVLK